MNRFSLVSGALFFAMSAAFAADVTLMKLPGDALQPKTLIDSSGTVHLLSYRGDARAGDLLYARRKAGASSFGG